MIVSSMDGRQSRLKMPGSCAAVTYAVQGTTNLLSTWPTLGKVANTQTSFSFTSWSTGPQQFFRVLVP